MGTDTGVAQLISLTRQRILGHSWVPRVVE